MPCRSSNARTAVPSSATVYGRSGAGEPPCPGSSYRSSRNRADSAGSCRSHTAQDVPSEFPSTRTGASAGPSREEASGSGPVPDGGPGSDIEEHGLAIAAQPDVEPELARPAAGNGGGDERLP